MWEFCIKDKTFGDKIKRLDVFGQPIKLTYSGRPTFNTYCGSVLTIIMWIVMGAYTINALIKIYYDDISSMNSQVRWYDLSKADAFSPGGANFNLGFGFNGVDLDPEIAEWKIIHQEFTKDQSPVITNFSTFPCNTAQEKWTNNDSTDWHFGKLSCTDVFDKATLQGDKYTAKVFQNINIRLERCKPVKGKKTCKSKTKQDAFFQSQGKNLQLIYQDTYPDQSDSVSPIKFYTNHNQKIILEPGRLKQTEINLRRGNMLTQTTFWNDNQSTYEMGNIFHREGSDSTLVLAEFNIQLDNRELVITKKNFTWTALLASVGGIQKSLSSLFAFLTIIISRRLFMASVLSNLYFIEEKKAIDDDVRVNFTSLRRHSTINIDDASQALKGKVDKDIVKVSFCNERERKSFYKLKESISNNKVEDEDLFNIARHAFKNRKNFGGLVTPFSLIQLLYVTWVPCSFLHCLCCGNRSKKGTLDYKRAKLFSNGKKRFGQQLDVIKLMKSARIARLLYRTLATQEQRMLMQIQRTDLISSDSNDEVSSDGALTYRNLASKQDFVRIFALGKVNRVLKKFKGRELTPLDKRLLKGFYIQNEFALGNSSTNETNDTAKNIGKDNWAEAQRIQREYDVKRIQKLADLRIGYDEHDEPTNGTNMVVPEANATIDPGTNRSEKQLVDPTSGAPVNQEKENDETWNV